MKTAFNRAPRHGIMLVDERVTQKSEDSHLPASLCATTKNEFSRLVIRRIQAGQVISVVTASSHHPHFASQFSESFDRNLDIPGIEYRETDADNPAQAETRVSASRAFAVNQCVGGLKSSDQAAQREIAA